MAVFTDRMRNRKDKDFEKLANEDEAMLDECQIVKHSTNFRF